MSENRTYDTDYTLRARDVFILSQSEPFPPAPSHLCIASLGSNELLKDGSVKVSATGQIILQCGPTFVGIDASLPTASVVVANGLPGTISLTQGAAPGAPEIKLTDLPPGISATAFRKSRRPV